MKFLALSFLLLTSATTWAKCQEEATEIAWGATALFDINDKDMHCMAAGRLKKIESLPVIAVMPARYAFEASFNFPCGPQPSEPKVKMLLNSQCKIVNLSVTGFSL